MNMQPIYPQNPVFYVRCAHCAALKSSQELVADLDGEPFKAYYCARECAHILVHIERARED